jgi:hypothetical protein
MRFKVLDCKIQRCLLVLTLALLPVFLSSVTAFAVGPRMLDDVPLPDDASPVQATASPFAGTWVGSWNDSWRAVLIVESVASDDEAHVVYAIGKNRYLNFDGEWARYEGRVVGEKLIVKARHADITYNLSPTGRLRGVYGKGTAFAVMTKQKLARLLRPETEVPWRLGQSLFLKIDLRANDKDVRLEAVIVSPSQGDGRWPLAVVNHGSTGFGNDPELDSLTWTNDWFAGVLNARGWLVAFPPASRPGTLGRRLR